MALLDEVRAKKPALEALAQRYGVSNIRVFGSVLQGQESAASDIDLLVHVSAESGLLDVGAFSYEASQLFDRRLDIVPDDCLHPLLQQRILEEARPL